ncbi:MAG TPA: hypothetical protein VEC18_08910 [Myxococcota bacterium]|nr:hypothetical protein [Myxococcota bacterium]
MGKLLVDGSVQIERSTPRALFAELLAGALERFAVQPSPMAVAYLVELLDERVLVNRDGLEGEQTLAEALLVAQFEEGADRIRRMRGLGDHALFVSGFLADHLLGRAIDTHYYRQIGSLAYGDVVRGLRSRGEAGSWARLYGELAEHFGEFVELLAEVGDRTRSEQSRNLLGIFERYLITGSARDRERLLRAGQLLPDRSGTRWWQ